MTLAQKILGVRGEGNPPPLLNTPLHRIEQMVLVMKDHRAENDVPLCGIEQQPGMNYLYEWKIEVQASFIFGVGEFNEFSFFLRKKLGQQDKRV